VGTVELQIPKLRQGSYFPSLLEPRRRAERALAAVWPGAMWRGCRPAGWTMWPARWGWRGSPSQVAGLQGLRRTRRGGGRLAEQAPGRRPDPCVWIDALSMKVREGGRVCNTAVLVATACNADGHRELLGLEVGAAEDGASWTAFLRGLVARGLQGVRLVTSDAHAGLKEAIAAVLDGASWQRCRTHGSRKESTWWFGRRWVLLMVDEVQQRCRGGESSPGSGDGVAVLFQQRADVQERVADGAWADAEQLGQDAPGADAALG